MSESKQKARRHADIIQDARCVYCGLPSNRMTIEHMPPRIMFRGKMRLKGLEFACCEPCNEATRKADLVAAMMGRTLPADPTSQDEFDNKKIQAGIKNNIPGCLEEMLSLNKHQDAMRFHYAHDPILSKLPLSKLSFFYTGGPIVNHYMNMFAAKIGFALHREVTGKPVLAEGGVRAHWITNTDMMRDGGLEHYTARLLGKPVSLRQGTKDLGEQFLYACSEPDDRFGVYAAKFFSSFAVVTFVEPDRSKMLASLLGRKVFGPGDFKDGDKLGLLKYDS